MSNAPGVAPPEETRPRKGSRRDPWLQAAPADPCILVIFGAAGDLTKRLLAPSLYNLACDGLLPSRFSVVGMARAPLTTDSFREKLTAEIRQFSTRAVFDERVWDGFVGRLHYSRGSFDDPTAFAALAEIVSRLDAEVGAGGNVLFYMATPPASFGVISEQLEKAGLKSGAGWRRIVVEKPFGHDLYEAVALNREILRYWSEDQVYRIDHYLGKETVQNLLAFRFANGIFEPLWNKTHVDHIQFTVAETVGVEGRGRYYEKAGVLRDMIQNHMFQMLAYLTMEPPSSFKPDAIRNEKFKVLDAVRLYRPDEVHRFTVRGQYGPGRKGDKQVPGYRQEPDVDPQSRTETFAAFKLFIDNWRWEGVPIYLRSGKSLWKRGTEIIVQFKKAPEVIFRDVPQVDSLAPNQLIFHIQPDQGIELRFQGKAPGPTMSLQKVNMRFDYREAFEASRGTGYEVLLYNCMIGDATLFSRTDLVEAAWRIAQPVLDGWTSAISDLPTYEAGSWGPRESYDLLERDGRKWLEVVNRAVLERVPLFREASPVFLHSLALVLKPEVYPPSSYIVRKGDEGNEMFFLARGDVDVIDGDSTIRSLSQGAFFGERALLTDEVRSASIRTRGQCDVYVLERGDFLRVLRDHPTIARTILETSRTHYSMPGDAVLDSDLVRFLEREA